jgi:hypothetical protein
MACRILGNIYKLIIWAAISVFRPNLFALAFPATKKDFHSSRAAVCGIKQQLT